ncbi:MAG: AAA family ATPase [Hydrogenophaga sp.]|uniref:AAA family ATPase n=1 Tax=Hydrogenophaga sp. TaxID=1904254 RepID=UPI002AB91DAA|nr:AAA family ATPase [Hydrogenophaga sp.]MDZ4188582.1 AAA family ATPase [Hydrogenophaga sp.]
MRIRELKLIRYGKFTDRTLNLPHQERDIHFIVGPNEAGKSTVRTAIGDWLFGIPPRTPLAFLHPMPDLRLGGVLEQRPGADTLQPFAFDRTKGNKNTLRTPTDTTLPDTALQPWLGNMQATAFNRMYALDHSTLVQGGAGILSASDDMGRLLFQSAAGVQHLGESLQKLQQEADAIWAPRKSAARIYYQAQDALDAAQTAFKQATLRTKDWKTLHDALADTAAALADARQRDVDIRQQLSRLERIRRVRPMLMALDAARAEHDALAHAETPLLPDNAAQVLSTARQELALLAADVQRLQRAVAHTQTALAATPVDPHLLALAPDITELNERRLQFRAHRTDIVKRSDEIRLEWQRVQTLASGLGWPVDSEDALRQRLPAAPVRARLARLLKQRVLLSQDLRGTERQLAEHQQQRQHTEQALARLGAGAVHPGLAPAVEQALQLGDHATAMAEASQHLARLAQQIDDGLAALGRWRQDPAALRAMLVPDDALVQSLLSQHRSDAAEAQSHQSALAQKTQDLQRLERELEQLVRDFQPVSRDHVQQARQSRDATWSHIKQTPQHLHEHAASFEAQVQEADHLADARLDRAAHEAARQAKTEQLGQQRLEQSHLASREQAVQQRMAQRLADWHTLARTCGLPELPLDMAPVWLQQRQRVLALHAEHSQVSQQQATQTQEAARIQHALWALLNPDASAEPDSTPAAPELAECLRRARALITQAEQAQGQRNSLQQQQHEAQTRWIGLQTQLQAAQTAWQDWEQPWQAALAAAGYPATALADQVEADLDTLQEIDRLLGRIRSIRSERIENMQADLNGLANTAQTLAAQLLPELDPEQVQQNPEHTAQTLASRLALAQQAAATAAELQDNLQRSQAELAAAQRQQHAVQARLAPLMSAAGLPNDHSHGHESDKALDALASAIEQSDQRRQAQRNIQATETALAQAADGLPLDGLRQDIAAIGPDELKAQLEQLSQQASAVVEEIAAHSNRHGTQKTAFDALDGTDSAALAEARRQEALAAMGDAAERYLKLHTAARLLKWSMEKFRETKQGPMLAKASAHFSGLTRGSFSRLLVDTEEATPRLFGIRPNGQAVDVTGMSEGSRDQLYLALRLAALELQIDQGLCLPLVADDLFINFDDDRTTAGLQVLGDLSRKMQVVFLTHHDHLVPLAQEALGGGVNVVYL